jgi:hypothetical protein
VKSNRTAPAACNVCGKPFDTPTAAEASRPLRPPRPGDISICRGCGNVAVLDSNLRAREMNEVEFAALRPEEFREISRARKARLSGQGKGRKASPGRRLK